MKNKEKLYEEIVGKKQREKVREITKYNKRQRDKKEGKNKIF